MKTWKLGSFGNLPDAIEQGCHLINAIIDAQRVGRHPQLVEVCTSWDDWEDWVFEVAPGVRMQVTREADVVTSDFAEDAAKSAIAVARHGTEHIQAVTDLGRHLRRIIAEKQSEGLPIGMHRVHLADIRHWPAADTPLFLVGYEAPGPNLQPELHWFATLAGDALDQRFSTEMLNQHRRRNAVIRLGRKGADGIIDEMALRAALRDPLPDQTIRRLRDTNRLQVTDGTVLAWRDGIVSSTNNGEASGVAWSRELVTLTNLELPSTVCLAAIGQPITRIVSHHAFSDQMIIEKMDSGVLIDGPETNISLRVPAWYIDTTTGAFWRDRSVDTVLRAISQPRSRRQRRLTSGQLDLRSAAHP